MLRLAEPKCSAKSGCLRKAAFTCRGKTWYSVWIVSFGAAQALPHAPSHDECLSRLPIDVMDIASGLDSPESHSTMLGDTRPTLLISAVMGRGQKIHAMAAGVSV